MKYIGDRNFMINDDASSNNFSVLTKEIVFIDSQVEDYQSLFEGVLSGIKKIMIDRERDGIEQITEVLNQKDSFTTIHIIANDDADCLDLGNSQLSLNTLSQYRGALRSWFPPNWNYPESANYNLFLYGCNVGTGDVGQEFILQLCILTNADVATFSTPIGNIARSNNGYLESQTEPTIVSIPFEDDLIED